MFGYGNSEQDIQRQCQYSSFCPNLHYAMLIQAEETDDVPRCRGYNEDGKGTSRRSCRKRGTSVTNGPDDEICLAAF